jgi:hypothetical protein
VWPAGLQNNSLLIGYIVCKGNETDLTNAAANVINAGKFGGTASSSAVTTMQQAYDNSTIPQILTSSANPLTIRPGNADTDQQLTVQDILGTSTNFAVTGQGHVDCKDLRIDNKKINLGELAGDSNQGIDAVAIGRSAGRADSGNYSVSIGTLAGEAPGLTSTYGDYVVSLGFSAGRTLQRQNSVAIGRNAGKTSQLANCIAVGPFAGELNQKTGSVLIGDNSGQANSGAYSVGIGSYVHCNSLDAITIGHDAEINAFSEGSIVIGTNSIITANATTLDGENNCIFGQEILCPALVKNSVCLGYQAHPLVSNEIVLGGLAVTHIRGTGSGGNGTDLGTSANPFKDLHLEGNIIGHTSSLQRIYMKTGADITYTGGNPTTSLLNSPIAFTTDMMDQGKAYSISMSGQLKVAASNNNVALKLDMLFGGVSFYTSSHEMGNTVGGTFYSFSWTFKIFFPEAASVSSRVTSSLNGLSNRNVTAFDSVSQICGTDDNTVNTTANPAFDIWAEWVNSGSAPGVGEELKVWSTSINEI